MKGVLRQIRKARATVTREISANASHGKYGSGLSAEGYAGGYRDALEDIEAAMRGYPNANSRYWPKTKGDR